MKQRRILIIRPDRIGDVVLTTPLIKAVKSSFPGSFVGVMVQPRMAPLLDRNPSVDIIVTDDPDGADAGRSGFWKQVALLRGLAFDTGLMPLPRERHAWMMFLAGIRTRIGVGTKLYQALTGMKSVSRHNYIPPRHEADYVMDLGRRIGVANDECIPELFIGDEERTSMESSLRKHGFDLSRPVIGINPGSNHSSPNWTPERYAELIERLLPDYQVAVNVGPRDSGLKDYYVRFPKVFLFDSDDLRELMAFCSTLSLLVASSTGTMHIAAALKVPTVSLFSPLTACAPERWQPLGNPSTIVLPPEGYCQVRCPKDPKICVLDEVHIEAVLHHIKRMVPPT